MTPHYRALKKPSRLFGTAFFFETYKHFIRIIPIKITIYLKMKKTIIKEVYFLGIPRCNNESPCTIEFINDELIMTILMAFPPTSIRDAFKNTNRSEILKIRKEDILGIEFGDGKPNADAQSAAGCAGCLSFGILGAVAARSAAANIQDYPLKLSIKYNNLPIEIRFKPSGTMKRTYQEILTFWHS